jgi:alpha-1,3-rhamnosyl/mannosyltransferase
LSWDEHAEGKVETAYFERVLPAAMNKCAAIVTISESSENAILQRWPWFESKLSVIPHGIASEYFTDDRPELPESLQTQIGNAPYVIYLGGPIERKRFSWALEVIAHCKQNSVKLIACGFGPGAKQNACKNVPAELRDRVLFANFLSDSELLALYRGAQSVLYPTLYEGFGFPAVEAQAAGVPVIFSALGSLRELIGPLALVVPPFELDAWLNALTEALSMGDRRAEKAQAARIWAGKFSWSQSFAKHLAVYRKAAAALAG